MKHSSRYQNLLFIIILLAYLLYAGVYIYRTSFIMDGSRYFVLFDDAMISMRYARNLAEGYGLVWNPGGEKIEGFSNPLWVGLMAVFHLLPLPASQVSLLVQISSAIFLALNLFFVKEIAKTLSENGWVGLSAAFLTAFYAPLNNWGLQGMEVSLLVLMVNTAIWGLLQASKAGIFAPWPYLLLGFATLLRIDAAVILVAALIFAWFADPGHRQRHLFWGLGSLIFFLGGQTLLRLWYYGDPLPNTYYLKISGVPIWYRLAHGAFVFFRSVWIGNWVLFLLPVYLLIQGKDRKMLLLFAIFILQALYSIYAGGDAWEHKGGTNRFVSTVMPLFFVLFSLALEQIRQGLLSGSNVTTRLMKASQIGLAVLVILSLCHFNTLLEQDALKKWLLLKRPIFVQGTMHATQIGLRVAQITTPEARVAVITAGAIPYFANRYTIDMLGKNDAIISRGPMHIKYNLDALMYDYRPGHNKWDPAYSIGELQPDLIAQSMAGAFDEAAAPYLSNKYSQVFIDGNAFYLRNNSPNILWEVVTEMQDARGSPPAEATEEE